MTTADKDKLRQVCTEHAGAWWSGPMLDLLNTNEALRAELAEEKRDNNRSAQELSQRHQDWDAL